MRSRLGAAMGRSRHHGDDPEEKGRPRHPPFVTFVFGATLLLATFVFVMGSIVLGGSSESKARQIVQPAVAKNQQYVVERDASGRLVTRSVADGQPGGCCATGLPGRAGLGDSGVAEPAVGQGQASPICHS